MLHLTHTALLFVIPETKIPHISNVLVFLVIRTQKGIGLKKEILNRLVVVKIVGLAEKNIIMNVYYVRFFCQ